MRKSFWRSVHLFLAIFSSLFLLVLTITGGILALDQFFQKVNHPYQSTEFETLTLSKTIENLEEKFSEITKLSVKSDYLILEGVDLQGESVNAVVHPQTGEILGQPLKESVFIKDMKTLHRSLFLDEVGRFLVGVVSIFLFFTSISGFLIILKRNRNFFSIFKKTGTDFSSKYIHAVFGKWFLIPILIISLSGSYLFLKRFDLILDSKEKINQFPLKNTEKEVNLKDFPIFKNTKIKEIESLEFPFVLGDLEDHFVLKMKDKVLEINAFSGELTQEKKSSFTLVLQELSLDLHTGRGSAIWALVLFFVSIGVLIFIWTGFKITFSARKNKNKIKNYDTAHQAKYIILVGTETGDSLVFAQYIQRQFISLGEKVFVCYLNDYQEFTSAKFLIFVTSTYGDGQAPASAKNFEKLLEKYPQKQPVAYSVLGLGSTHYRDFCAFAKKIDEKLEKKQWATRFLEFHSVNQSSVDDFLFWVKNWNQKSSITFSENEMDYGVDLGQLVDFKVVRKTKLDERNQIFSLELCPLKKINFHSGDILAIYPNGKSKREYSIGKVGENIQLLVKLHLQGLGSGYLYGLSEGERVKAKVIENESFKLPSHTRQVIMIANGTGLAPFLGVLKNLEYQNVKKYLYAGFRYKVDNEVLHNDFFDKNKFEKCEIAYSKEENFQYVMHILEKDKEQIAEIVKNGGVVMICGALAMKKNVEEVLERIFKFYGLNDLEEYYQNQQILTDCY